MSAKKKNTFSNSSLMCEDFWSNPHAHLTYFSAPAHVRAIHQKKCQNYTKKEDAQSCDLTSFFGDWSQMENLSEIKQPLDKIQYSNFMFGITTNVQLFFNIS